jgi:hypothetical protein
MVAIFRYTYGHTVHLTTVIRKERHTTTFALESNCDIESTSDICSLRTLHDNPPSEPKAKERENFTTKTFVAKKRVPKVVHRAVFFPRVWALIASFGSLGRGGWVECAGRYAAGRKQG